MNSQIIVDDILLFCARVVVGSVFLAAGAMKAMRLGAFRHSLMAWEIGKPAAYTASIVIPIAEVAGAFGLLYYGTATKLAALGTSLLAGLLSLAIAYKLMRGSRPNCHCFGQSASTPISIRHFVHALLLAVAALLIALTDSQDLPPVFWYSDSIAAFPVLLVVGIIASVLLRSAGAQVRGDTIRYLLTSIDELRSLPVGTPAPDVRLCHVTGEKVSLKQLCGLGLPVAIIFVHPGCGECKRLIAALTRDANSLARRVTVVLISSGDASQTVAAYGKIFVVVLQEGEEARILFRSSRTPSAVLIDSDCRISSPMVAGTEAIARLVKSTFLVR